MERSVPSLERGHSVVLKEKKNEFQSLKGPSEAGARKEFWSWGSGVKRGKGPFKHKIELKG